MNSTVTVPLHTPSDDEDLAEQARPGHGVPSQDPNPAAQMPLQRGEAAREAKSVLAGGGMVGGTAVGAAIGAAAGGPVGIVVGGALGAVAGALGGAAAGPLVDPAASSGAAPVLEDSPPAAPGVKPRG